MDFLTLNCRDLAGKIKETKYIAKTIQASTLNSRYLHQQRPCCIVNRKYKLAFFSLQNWLFSDCLFKNH